MYERITDMSIGEKRTEPVKVSILGSGVTAQRLLRILKQHPHVRITGLSSGREQPTVPPDLLKGLDVSYQSLTPDEIADCSDVAFACGHDEVAGRYVPTFLKRGKKFIDFGGAYRLHDPHEAKQFYQNEDTEHLAQAIYGQPDLFAEQVRQARFVANPGCYPTASILALAPLVKARVIDFRAAIVIVAWSGYSGAGAAYKPTKGLRSYKVGEHRHRPEIRQALKDYLGAVDPDASEEIRVTFTPFINDDVEVGLQAHTVAQLTQPFTTSEVGKLYEMTYRDEALIKVVDSEPDAKDVVGAHCCQIAVWVQDGVAKAIGSLDNTLKGASTQAVQNMNLMSGFAKNEGLLG